MVCSPLGPASSMCRDCHAAASQHDTRDRAHRPPWIGERTRILIIDDDRLPGASVPAARLTLHQADGAPGDRERNRGKAEAGEAGQPASRAVTAGDGNSLLPVDPVSGGTVLDMDPELVRDVLARVQELLAQAKADANESVPQASEQDDIAIDLPTQTVWRSGRPIRVSPTEFRLLVALVRRRGAVVSREVLRRDVWPGGPEVQCRVIDTHIARLRRKLEDDPKRPRHILTALAAGYRFLA